MDTFSYLQPNLMTTEQLRDHLKMRFPNQNVLLLQRDELLKLFSMYAVPKSRRVKANEDIEMKPESNNARKKNEQKRPRHQPITAPTVETVTNACKKIRLINTTKTEHSNTNNIKRLNSMPMESDQTQTNTSTQSKRQKITWP